MKNKLFSIFLLAFTFCALFALNSSVKAATPTYNADDGYVLNGSQKCFFANGTPITKNIMGRRFYKCS